MHIIYRWNSTAVYFWLSAFNSGATAEVNTGSPNTFYWLDGTPLASDMWSYLSNNLGSTADYRVSACSGLTLTSVSAPVWTADSGTPSCLSTNAQNLCGKLSNPCVFEVCK